MSGPSYWITTANGYFAQVEGDEERDRWTPLGWRVAGEPGPGDFVYLRKDGVEGRAAFVYEAVPTWQEMGWQYADPPEPVDVTHDPVVVEQPETSPQKTKGKPAAGAAKNSEE